MQVNLGMDTGWTNWSHETQGEHFDAWLSRGNVLCFKGVNISSKVWECHDLQRKQIIINVLKIKCPNRYNYVAMIPSEAV